MINRSETIGGRGRYFSGPAHRAVCLLAVITFCAGCTSVSAPGVIESSEGAPSEAEYRAAVQQAADCASGQGVNVSAVALEDDEVTWNYSFHEEPGVTEEATERDRQIVYNCYLEHRRDVEQAYMDSLLLTGAEWDAEYRELVSCYESTGITDVKVGDSSDRLVSLAYNMSEGDDAEPNYEAVDCYNKHRIQLFGTSQ